MNICLDEAFTNIVSYGFTDDIEHLIKFTIDWDNDVLILRVEDDGIPFNPLAQKDPEIATDLLNIKVGGLGIHIIKKLMDDICYRTWISLFEKVYFYIFVMHIYWSALENYQLT
jgi:anti-sigma regulatory factor (Ser/Thr protein kinase)